jgi:hypothetical protein
MHKTVGEGRPRRFGRPALSGTAFGVHVVLGGVDRGWSLRSTPGYLLGPLPGSVVPGAGGSRSAGDIKRDRYIFPTPGGVQPRSVRPNGPTDP